MDQQLIKCNFDTTGLNGNLMSNVSNAIQRSEYPRFRSTTKLVDVHCTNGGDYPERDRGAVNANCQPIECPILVLPEI